MKKYNLAIVGATGMVGEMTRTVLEERQLPIENYYLFASERSAGKKVMLDGKEHIIEELTPTCFDGKEIDIALFCAGGTISEEYASCAVKAGALVIDNSSAFRMDPDCPLVVPEVNGARVKDAKKGIIANPNCSTIQAMLPLKAIYDKYGLKRVIYSTYQSVSGAGVAGHQDLVRGENGEKPQQFVHPIHRNILPHIDSFLDNGYTKEEMKMVNETKKILEDDTIGITATTVRVPTLYGHCESVNLELRKPYELEELIQTLKDMDGVIVMDDPKNNIYPMPLNTEGKDEVYVGRIRRDDSVENGLNIWIVADNIRKGAATNAVQIAEKVIEIQREEA